MARVDVKFMQLVESLDLNRGRYSLLLGAGCSVSAGIPLATADVDDLLSVTSQIKRRLYRRAHAGRPLVPEAIEAWLKAAGLLQQPSTLYADALEAIAATPFERRTFLEQLIDGRRPTEGHRRLARLTAEGLFRVIFTTNFDPLIETALRAADLYPIVIAHDAALRAADVGTRRPVVIKLHGDYLFGNLRNLGSETATLEANMQENFARVLAESGLIVLGFAGHDRSIMRPLEVALRQGAVPFGLRWVTRHGAAPPEPVVNRTRSLWTASRLR